MNKRTVVLVVIIECILAVLLVSFMGRAIENFDRKTYAEKIYFIDENGERLENNAIIEVEITDMNISYQLDWVVEPNNTSNKDVVFVSSRPDEVIVDNTGLVTFLVDSDVIITIKTTDGSEITASITLVVKDEIIAEVDI